MKIEELIEEYNKEIEQQEMIIRSYSELEGREISDVTRISPGVIITVLKSVIKDLEEL